MNIKRILKKTCKWSLIGCSALLLFAVLFFGFVQTGPGKETIRVIVGKSFTKDREQSIDIGRIEGFVPFDIRVDHLTFWDAGSQWLRLEGVSLRWSPLTLLGGNLIVDELRILSARLSRLPVDRRKKAVKKEVIPPWVKILHRLQLQKFCVESMVLEASVLGEEAVFKMEGGMGVSFPDGAWETRINIERLDRNGVPTTLRALFKGKGSHMTADALMEEPAGGLVARILGFEGPILLSLKGRGPTNAWKGTVNAKGGTLGEVQAVLELSMSEMDLQLTAEGHVRVDPSIVPDPLIHWIDQNTSFELRGSIHRKSRMTIDDLKLKSEKAALQINASVDLVTESIDGQFKLQIDDFSPIEKLASIKGTGGTADGRISGLLLKPEASLDFNATALQADDIQAKEVQGHVKVTFVKPIDVAPIEIRVQGVGKFGEVAFKKGNENIQEKGITWNLAMEGFPKERLSIEQLKLTGNPASVLLSGWIDTSRHTGSVDANIDIADLSALSRFLNRPLVGKSRMQAKINGDSKSRSLSAKITGEYQPPETSNTLLISFVDRKVGYSGTLTYDGQKKIHASNLLLDTLSGTLKGDVAYILGDGALNGVFQMEIPKLDRLSSVLGKEIQGSVSVKGAIKGPFQKLGVEGRIVSREIRFEKRSLERLSTGFRFEGFPPENKGQLDFELFLSRERVFGKTHFAITDNRVSLDNLSFNGAGVEITGALDFDPEQRLIEGTLQGATGDLVPLSALFKQEVKGAAQILLEASGTKSGQRFAFKIDSNDVSIPEVFAGKVKLQGEIDKAFEAPEGLVRLLFQDGQYKGIRVTYLEMNLSGKPKQFHFGVNVEGKSKKAFNLETSGRVLLSQQGHEILLNRFQGRYGKLPLNLVRPVVVNSRIDALDIKPMTLQIGLGRLEGSGKIGKEASLSMQFMDIPLSVLPMSIAPDLKGMANGQFQLRGSSANPEVTGRLRVTGLGMRLSQTEDLPPGILEVKTELRAGRLHADMTLQGITTTPMRARFESPMALTLTPFSVSLPNEKPMSGEFTGEVNVGLIADIFALHDQVLDGQMAFNLNLEGHIGGLKIRGGGRIENGLYENVRTGTILKDIEALFEAQHQRIVIQNAQASDGESGQIKAQGWVDIIPAAGFPFLIDLVLDEAKSWRHDDVMVTLRGPLKFSGSLKTLLLEGGIQIARAEIRIPDRLPPDIVQLEVVEINPHGSGSTVNHEESPTPRSIQRQDLRLDVSIWSSGHVFVEGRGLSSEWKANVHVNGTAAVPVITGQFSVIRGHVNFLGKRFNLTRGIISFSGATPPSPQIDVLGESRANDMTARIELTGRLNHPTVKLSSDPELPQDEVLSRLLFGRSLTSITPYQAVQLASAANALAGGGGFDLLGETRKILGVDQLEIKNLEGDKGETAISAGKYLSENVYMEIEKGLGPKGGKGSVVWEITPNITVETEVGENAEIGGGVNWKWDY